MFSLLEDLSNGGYLNNTTGLPGMADANDMIHIAENEFEKLVGQDTRRICKSKERVIRKHRPQPHSAGVQDTLMAEAAQTGMAMHNINLLPNHDVAEDGEERENGRKCRGPVDDQKGDVVDLESIREISHAGAAFVRVRDDDDLVPSVNELRG